MLTLTAFLLASLIPAALPQEQEAPPAPGTKEQILAAIEKLRSSYDLADRKVREAVELPAPSPAERSDGLQAAKSSLDQLTADLEALIQLLPPSS